MKQGESWEDALEAAKAGNEEDKEKQAGWRAPGLHSPAGLLAVLIVA